MDITNDISNVHPLGDPNNIDIPINDTKNGISVLVVMIVIMFHLLCSFANVP